MREGAGAQGVGVHFQRSWRGVLPSLHFRSRRIPLLGLILLFVAIAAMLFGCEDAKHQANKIDGAIHAQTSTIGRAARDAQGHIANADASVVAATVDLLSGAHSELGAASKSLQTISPAAAAIDRHADRAAQLTAKVQTKLDSERDHWLGYKARVTLWTFAILSPVLFVLVFIVKTNGGGPILSAIGEIIGNAIGFVWRGIVFIAKLIFHLLTLGSSKVADITNKHYDLQHSAPSPDTSGAK
jgi:hypothetical protein